MNAGIPTFVRLACTALGPLSAAWLALQGPGATAARADPIVIGVIGDQTGATDLDASYRVLKQGVTAINSLDRKPDVVLHVGDLIESTETPEQITARFGQATSILKTLTMPWYTTPGDHDVNPTRYLQNSTDRSRETLYKQLYSPLNPLVKDKLYYSFDVKNWHFIALDSLEHLYTDPRWGNVFYSQISDNQFAWLQRDLEAHAQGKDGIIVFTHQPLWYNWTGWSRVHELLARYPVKAVIAGHTHYNQTDTALGGIRYWVVGSTGGDIKDGSANAGHLHHVSLLSLSGAAVDFRLIPLAPFTQSDWTSRTVMDQVQAVTVNLGNLYDFDQKAKVFLDGDRVVGACGTQEPATVTVANVGNATADPLNVSIVVNSTSVRATAGTFGAGFCDTSIDEFSCQLVASAGVAVSNNSIVQMSTYPVPPPLWVGTVVAGSGASPKVGDPIELTLTMMFRSENKSYTMAHSGKTTIKACR
ncbi:hypothetical protein FF100_30030 [Methylobacterium terricola]|uniref:Calcineurin-like phosphoesterase domain-containing protein n=1 Tax=Methylobacterium terricola TaxID=2583531 RepID=A0A5C4L9Z7_9HYPH|nr:metallophosphoesterase [Methylobacterium terricola]TNC08155.1 hypothetical protein FF100_30030 [Methylobacterium terricola]